METIKILQHNVQSWRNRKNELINKYIEENPDIILINSHGLIDNENIKIRGYTSYTKNIFNEYHDGTAVLIKQNIKHKIIDEFITNTVKIKIETTIGPISIATNYLPLRRP